MIRYWILLITFCAAIATSETVMAMITVKLGSAQVDLSAGSGVTTATLDVSFSNMTATAAPIAGYTLFLDIEPADLELPMGVSFAEPAVTYLAGLGTEPLPSAGPGTVNLAPAAGDIGLGQLQFSNSTIGAGESFTMFTVNLTIDLAQAESGLFDVFLNPQGDNSLNTLDGSQPFTAVNGLLTLISTPVLAGDFDMDGDVDGNDFLWWQRGQSTTPLSPTDLADWESQYGVSSLVAAHSARNLPTLQAVPEPGALCLGIFATVLVAGTPCRRRRVFLS